jgi:hypothetical protein
MVTGKFFVLTLGRRYVRDLRSLMVGQQLQHAEQFPTRKSVLAAKRQMQFAADSIDKPLCAWAVSIEEVT